MLLIHIIAIASVLVTGWALIIIYAGGEEYIELKTDLHNKFSSDLDYTIELMKDLTPNECEKKIDEFESKWGYCINDRQLKTAIGKLIDAQFRYSNSIGF
jgi:hypothetical protein